MHPAVSVVEVTGYISILKLVPLLVLLMLWAKLLTWADKDTVAAHLPREVLNAIFFFAGMAAFLLFFLMPNVWVAYGEVMVVLLGSAGTYLGLRNQSVGLKDLRKEFGKAFTSGKKAKKEAKPGEVEFWTKGGQKLAAPEGEDPERAGYDAAEEFLTAPLRRNAERVQRAPRRRRGGGGAVCGRTGWRTARRR